MKPQLFETEDSIPKGALKLDHFDDIRRELFFIEHPEADKKTSVAQPVEMQSIWAYYSESNIAVRIPTEAEYQKLRTARNRNLITPQEQRRYRDAVVGIAGLSVGSMALCAIAQTGGPRTIKIADPDIIELTNLNRIRARLTDLGANKTSVAAREAWLLDPFLEIEMWDEGITADTLERFVSEPRLHVFVDEMDDIALKIESRKVCKSNRIPVVMATDNGDSVIVDVERFDLEPDRPIFHGRITLSDDDVKVRDRASFIKLANEIIDPSMFTQRQWASIQQIGKTLSGVPQLASAAMIAGAAVAYAVRQIAISAPLPSGRYAFGCDSAFIAPL